MKHTKLTIFQISKSQKSNLQKKRKRSVKTFLKEKRQKKRKFCTKLTI
jgi:hypothetical protein